MEIIRADAIARYQTLQGREVFFNTGTDEHGQKLLTDAKAAGKEVKEYVDHFAGQFRNLKELLSISDNVHFIRTTDTHHEKAAQRLWEIVRDKGYIYKKNYETKYCVGCELEKTDSELVDGHCPIHPNKEIEIINEENYFFAFSKAAPLLKKLYEEKPQLVIPDFRFNEAKAFLERGLEDFSISRLKSKMSWGVPVPGDEEHNIDITRVELAKSHKNIPEKLWLDHIERFKQEVVLNTNIFDKTDEAEKDYYNS
jgi:methionyl-tRNA synthetase